MSVAEMKLAAINQISKLNDEKAMKDVLAYLASLSVKEDAKTYNLSQHYDSINKQYGNVLKKLAQ